MDAVINGPTKRVEIGVLEDLPSDGNGKERPSGGETTRSDSHARAKSRFSKVDKALRYPAEYRLHNAHDLREMAALEKALDYVPPRASILDLPCGAGRLTRLLLERGCEVRCADASPAMVALAKKNLEIRRLEASEGTGCDVSGFDVVDVMATPYKDEEFDAVVCNRLFHHFTESETRVRALRELRRVLSTTLIVSFFNSNSLDAYWRRFRNFARMRRPQDRLPISLRQFESELDAAGLRVVARIPARRFISQQFYIVATPKTVSR